MSVRFVAPFALLVSVIALVGCSRKPPEPTKITPPIVVVSYPVIREVGDYEDFAGRLEPIKVVELRCHVSGPLKGIYFKDGQDVNQGKRLFQIDDRLFDADLLTAKAALIRAETLHEKAIADHDRAVAAKRGGANSQSDLDQAISDRGVAASAIETAKAAIKKADTNVKYCCISAPFDGRVSKRMVDEENQIKADDTLLTTIVELDEVYATFDVDERTTLRVRRLIQKGARFNLTDQTLTNLRYVEKIPEEVVTKLNPLKGKELPQDEFQKELAHLLNAEELKQFQDVILKQVQKGRVTSSRESELRVQIALADDDDFSLSGPIVFTDNQVDAGTGTLRVRAIVRNPRLETAPWYLLSPGQFVRVRVPIGTPRPAILVPEKALGTDQGQRYVFVVNAKNEVERRNVRTGQQYGQFRVIEDGVVTPADRIIVDGLLRVRQGVEVNPKEFDPSTSKEPVAPLTLVPEAPVPHEKPPSLSAVPGTGLKGRGSP